MVNVYVVSSPAYYKVKFWMKQFKCKSELIKYDPRSAVPTQTSDHDICDKVEL